MASSKSVNDLPKRHAMKLSRLDKVSRKWFTAMRSRKPRTEHMITEKTKYHYDEMIITDLCTFSEGSKNTG